MKKFKVLHLNTFDSGGSAIAARRLHAALLSIGLESTMLFAKKENDSIPNSVEAKPVKRSFLGRMAFRVSRKFGAGLNYWEMSQRLLKGRKAYQDLFSLPFSELNFWDTEAYQNADIIHLHWVPSLLDYSFLGLCKKPVVWTIHDMNPFTGGCHYSASCEKYRTDCASCPQLVGTKNPDLSKDFLEYKKRFLNSDLLQVVTLSDWMSKKVKESSLLGTFQITKIYNSLDLDIFKPLDRGFARQVFNIPLNAKVVLFVSESIENYRKGFDLLADAIKDLGDDILFCSIGASKSEFEPSGKVRYLGKLSDSYSLVLAYNFADVVVLPSREDNLPNVMLESLCCGTPVIAFANGGAMEIIENYFNGLLVEDQNSKELTQGIMNFFRNQIRFDRRLIREKAEQLFSPAKQADSYIQLYSKSLNK
jgi:glycosyltransferase involved in cell wall biosynthesis